MKKVVLLLLMLYGLPTWAEVAMVSGFRMHAERGSERLVFVLDHVTSYKVFALKQPDRLVVDLEGGISPGDPRVIGDPWNRSRGIVARLIQGCLSSKTTGEERCRMAFRRSDIEIIYGSSGRDKPIYTVSIRMKRRLWDV